jgi:hypothetical protein
MTGTSILIVLLISACKRAVEDKKQRGECDYDYDYD